jgi:hypothetical protein
MRDPDYPPDWEPTPTFWILLCFTILFTVIIVRIFWL